MTLSQKTNIESKYFGDHFLRTKRNLIVSSGALLVSVFIGIDSTEGESLTGFTLKNPGALPIVLSIITLYSLYNYLLAWTNEPSTIKQTAINEWDFRVTVAVGALSLVLTFFKTVPPILTPIIQNLVPAEFEWSEIIEQAIPILSTIIATLAVAISIRSSMRIYSRFRLARQKAQATESEKLFEKLVSNVWKLIYNPSTYMRTKGEQGWKKMRFAESGDILEGKNVNEHSWQISLEFLELLSSDGRVFSRFYFNQESERFVHTNDTDTRSLPDQYLIIENDES